MVCYKCEQRKVGCHATCAEYKEYRKEKDRAMDERQRQNEITGVLKACRKNRIERSKGSSRKMRGRRK